jgi:protease I
VIAHYGGIYNMATHAKPLEGMKVAILVTDDFEQAELTEPRKALNAAGAKTVIISSKPGQVTGVNHDEKAEPF